MKNTKKTMILCTALAVLCALAACRQEAAPEVTETKPVVQTQPETQPTEPVTHPTEPEVQHSKRLLAYEAVLDRFVTEKVTAEGEDIGYTPDFGDIDINQYAIADLDGDGEEELLILYTTAPVAGQQAWVYGFDADTETVYRELSAFPYLEFYTGGLLKALWSHNQGLAGDALWPFTLMGYDPAQREYVPIATVDAWSKMMRDTDSEGNPFPEDIDEEGAGVVYFVTQGEETRTLSQSDFNQWLADTFGSASLMELEMRMMNER